MLRMGMGGLAMLLAVTGSVFAGHYDPLGPTAAQLKCMKPCELEAVYRQATVTALPMGYYKGEAVAASDGKLAELRADAGNKIWVGKHFTPDQVLINQWKGFRGVKAPVCLGESWIDGCPSIIMDYRGQKNLIWKNVRDEMREVCPGVFLGVMVRETKCGCSREIGMFFILEAECGCPTCH